MKGGHGLSKERSKPPPPSAAAPARTEGRGPEKPNASGSTRVDDPHHDKDPWWKMWFNLGAFVFGCTAGYWFCKAEKQVTRYGENLVVQFLKGMRREGGGYGTPWRESESRVPDRRERFHHDPDDDPMGEGGGSSLPEEDDDRI